jgi:hypothetical protein
MESARRWQLWVLLLLPVAGLAAGLWLRTEVREVEISAGGRSGDTGFAHEEVVRSLDRQPVLATTDDRAETVEIACSTCHTLRAGEELVRSPEELGRFHQGLRFLHGNLTCQACHNAGNYDTLRLSDGTPVAFAEVVRVCSQCHPAKGDAFAHGAHGGMNGHWDLNRGPRWRNNCVDCHHPHHPAYPTFAPAAGPKDRFPPRSGETHPGAGPAAGDAPGGAA